MSTLEDELFAYFYSQNTVNQPRRHAEAVARIVTDHCADRGQDVADVAGDAERRLLEYLRHTMPAGDAMRDLAAVKAKARADGAQEVTDRVQALADEWDGTVYKLPPGYPMTVNEFCRLWFKEPLRAALARPINPTHDGGA